MFIVIEGIDGSGKSSLAKTLKNYFDNNVMLIGMPSNNATGIKVREAISSGKLDDYKLKDLFIEDFSYTIKNTIIPALEAGKYVICDRYIYSFIAYQSETTSRKAAECGLNNINILQPDLVFLIDIDPRISLERIKREKDSIEKRGFDFFYRVRRNFLTMAQSDKSIFHIIDASIYKNTQEINEKCLDIIKNINVKNRL